MSSEEKNCQSCQVAFTIVPEDFSFYEKINVPPPTWCPDCRLQRRLAYRNERGLTQRQCSVPGHSETIISAYSDPKLTVYDQDYWWSDAWDATQFGQDYDFSKPFFVQFRELLERTPLIALSDSKSTDSSYCNITVEHKNCYFVSAGWGNEDCLYSNRISFCKDTMDSYVCHRTEYGYENVYCKDSHQLFYSRNSSNCTNSYFLYDCRSCTDCIGCTGLRNKQYYIFNKPYSKEEYEQKVRDLNLGHVDGLAAVREQWEQLVGRSVHKYAHNEKSENVVGDNVEESKNCYWCFDVPGQAEDSKYCNWATYGMKDCYDSGPGAGGQSELTYEGVSIGVNNARCAFGMTVWYSSNVFYGIGVDTCQDSFGCVSLRRKQYCILNKQYTKEEYEALLPKVIQHMKDMPYVDALGRRYGYGEYFPLELSPFRYNETVAQEFFPLGRDEAEQAHYPWAEPAERHIQTTKTAAELPKMIALVGQEITQEVIECSHQGQCNDQCTQAFKIQPSELAFLLEHNVPLPRLCFNCRHAARLAQRNPLKLWEQQCRCAGVASDGGVYTNTMAHPHGTDHCQNHFQTTFAPNRPEAVYCDDCYQQEVA